MVSTLGVAVAELAFGLCLGAIEVSVGPMVSVILAFIWLFLAAASLAVIGSGRVDLRRSNSLSNSSSSVNLEKLSSPKGFHPDISSGLLTFF